MTGQVGVSIGFYAEDQVVDLCPLDDQGSIRVASKLRDAVYRYMSICGDEEAIVRFFSARIRVIRDYKHVRTDVVYDATKQFVSDVCRKGKVRPFNAYVGDRVPPIADPPAITPISHEAIREMLSRTKVMHESFPVGC